MSFRRRITLVSAAAVAIAVVLASVLIYLLTSDQLHSQIDSQLRNRGATACSGGFSQNSTDRRRGRGHCGLGLGSFGSASARKVPAAPAGGVSAGNVLGRLPPLPNQVRGYQQRHRPRRDHHRGSATGITLPVERRARARWPDTAGARSSATRASTASTCASSPSPSRPAARCSSPSR